MLFHSIRNDRTCPHGACEASLPRPGRLIADDASRLSKQPPATAGRPKTFSAASGDLRALRVNAVSPAALAADSGCVAINAILCCGTALCAEGAEKIWRPSAMVGSGRFLLLQTGPSRPPRPTRASNGESEALFPPTSGMLRLIFRRQFHQPENHFAPPIRLILRYRKTLRFLSSRTFASSTIVRRATFHPPSTRRSMSSRHPDNT